MFFILTTGRSGSKSIAQFLSSQENVSCLHEPNPILLSESRDYLYGKFRHKELVQLLKETRENGKSKLYGESNQRLSFIVPALDEAFRHCKFIWLLRDGRDVVSSIYSRGWYSDDDIRISDFRANEIEAPYVENISLKDWRLMSSFDKCCWYWYFTNRNILKSLKKIEPNRWIIIKLEHIEHMGDYLLYFIGIPNRKGVRFPWVNRNAFMRKKHIAWYDWTSDQRSSFCKFCGKSMDIFYPNWRSPSGQWNRIQHYSKRQNYINNLQNMVLSITKPKSTVRTIGRRLLKGTKCGDFLLKIFNMISGV